MSNNGNNVPAIAKQYVAAVEKRVADLAKNGGLHLPADYSASNALRSAFLQLQEVQTKDKRPVLEACTPASITNALLSMVVQGLNVDKKQGYFIAYGQSLTFQRSYFGSMAVAKRVSPDIQEFAHAVVYEGDTLEYEIKRGKRVITKHAQSLGNIDKTKIVAAYCEAYGSDGAVIHGELMTMDEIKQAWRQSKMNPVNDKGEISQGGTHGKFTADMAMKTVINRCCKYIINQSDDSTLLQAVRITSEIADEHEAQAEAAEYANQKYIDVEPQASPLALGHDQETGEVLDMPQQEQPETADMADDLPPMDLSQSAQQAGPGF